MKRIIFDVDDTLIPWKTTNYFVYFKVAKKYKLKKTSLLKYFKALKNFLNHHEKININKLTEIMNEKFSLNLTSDFTNDLLYELSKKVPKKSYAKIHETLEYLKDKYELVVLTNWFIDCQVARMKSLGLDKYFKEFYGFDDFYPKPHKEAFLRACGEHNPTDCIMIGDEEITDIKSAIASGLDGIYFNSKNKKVENKDLKVIYKFEELKELL